MILCNREEKLKGESLKYFWLQNKQTKNNQENPPAYFVTWSIVVSASAYSTCLFSRNVFIVKRPAQEFLDKTERKLANTRGSIMAALVLLMHILWVNIKEKKKHPTWSDSQRHFATRKIKVKCGKAWGLCALGREGVRWAHIYSKARTAWGFHWPWQHRGCRPDPKPPFSSPYLLPPLPTIST